MTYFWLALMFFGIASLTYGLLGLRHSDSGTK